MEDVSFNNYCDSFLKNHIFGSKIFFQDKNTQHSYKQLIESAIGSAHYFLNSPDVFFALQFESSYKLFTHLLGAILAQKNVLILSHKEPMEKVLNLQGSIPFTKILNDQDQSQTQTIVNLVNDISILNTKIDSSRPAFFILSSGSSGPSKSISLSLDNVYSSAKSVIEIFKMTSQDTSFSNLPHHHIGGLMIFWRSFFSMGKVTTDESNEYQFISLVPLQLQRILDDQEKTNKLKSCRAVLIGGAPLDKNLKNLAAKKSIAVFETYGMSETCSLVMLNGKPLDGQIVKLDVEGHFLVKGKTLSHSVPVDSDGFYHTKDVGQLNPDGSYTFKYRGDLLFKSGGELINPQEIEAKTKELSWIVEATVVPVKHHEWTQAAVMVYKSNDFSKNADDIKKYLKTQLHPHLVPKYFIEAPKDFFQTGIKPRRFEISNLSQTHYYKELFHHLYIPNTSAKRLMVFFHGFMEDHSDLMALMDNHKEVSYLFIDLPGHGKTKASQFKSRSSVFIELASMINFYRKENSLVLYGYSMGGRIALELTLLGISPEMLILESAHFGLQTNEEKSSRLKADRLLFTKSELNLNHFFDAWYNNPIFANYNKSLYFKSDLEKKILHDPMEWQASLEFFSPGVFPFSSSEVIEKLSNQKIIGITGLLDHKYKSHYEKIRSNLDGLSIYEIEDCGHNPHKTHLSEVKRILNVID